MKFTINAQVTRVTGSMVKEEEDMFRWRLGRDPMLVEFERLQRGMDDLFEAMTGPRSRSGGPLWRQARLFPLLNVTRSEDRFIVTAEIPGMKTDDLELKVEGDTVALKGERKAYELGNEESFHRRERASGTFQRSLTLPARIDAQQVQAMYKNGVLRITLPIEKASLPKPIPITAG